MFSVRIRTVRRNERAKLAFIGVRAGTRVSLSRHVCAVAQIRSIDIARFMNLDFASTSAAVAAVWHVLALTATYVRAPDCLDFTA